MEGKRCTETQRGRLPPAVGGSEHLRLSRPHVCLGQGEGLFALPASEERTVPGLAGAHRAAQLLVGAGGTHDGTELLWGVRGLDWTGRGLR